MRRARSWRGWTHKSVYMHVEGFGVLVGAGEAARTPSSSTRCIRLSWHAIHGGQGIGERACGQTPAEAKTLAGQNREFLTVTFLPDRRRKPHGHMVHNLRLPVAFEI